MPKYELNLRDYWIIIQKRLWIIIAVVVVIFVGSVLYTNSLPYIYEATATIQIKERQSLGTVFSQLVSGTMNDPFISYTKVITSQPIMERAALELGLTSQTASKSEIAEKGRFLQGLISTMIIEGTNIIKIDVAYGDPNMAARIANKVAEVFIAENFKEKNKQTRQVREFIERQLADITAKLHDSEIKFKEFREKELPSGVAIPLQNRLADLETKRMELLRQYTELHPDIVTLTEDINNLKAQIKNLPQKELDYSRLSREVELNTKLYSDLKTRLEGARIAEAEKVEDVSILDPAVVPPGPVSPNKRTSAIIGLALGILVGFVAAFVVEELDTSIGTIEDVESFIKLPVLGVIPYIEIHGEKENIFNRLWPKHYKGEERNARLRSQLLIYHPARSAMVEAYKLIRTNIEMEIFKSEPKGKILLISSSSPEEGKTLTTANLALVFAQSGNTTLLIDADLRRASTHKIFGLNKEPGLTDVLRGSVRFEDAVRTFADTVMGSMEFDKLLQVPGIDNLNILPCGSSPVAPAEILGTEELKKLFSKLRERYDIVIIDSPPILAVADAVIIAPKTDGVILIYKVGKTASAALMRTKMQLEAVNVPCKGVILNNISAQIEMRTSYYYHYKYYGEKKSHKPA